MKKQQQPKQRQTPKNQQSAEKPKPAFTSEHFLKKVRYTGPVLRQTIIRAIQEVFKWAIPHNIALSIFDSAIAAGAIEQAGDVNGVPLYIFTEKPYICDVHGVEIPETGIE
jgi:hypothetical protein